MSDWCQWCHLCCCCARVGLHSSPLWSKSPGSWWNSNCELRSWNVFFGQFPCFKISFLCIPNIQCFSLWAHFEEAIYHLLVLSHTTTQDIVFGNHVSVCLLSCQWKNLLVHQLWQAQEGVAHVARKGCHCFLERGEFQMYENQGKDSLAYLVLQSSVLA